MRPGWRHLSLPHTCNLGGRRSLSTVLSSVSAVVARDQAQIAYDTCGDLGGGVPIVLVTGTSHLKSDWFAFPRALSQSGFGRGVITIDTRGMGESRLAPAQTASDLAVSQLAADVLDVLHALRLSRAHIIGWSLGSIVVQHLLLNSTWLEHDGFSVEGITFPRAILAASCASSLNLAHQHGRLKNSAGRPAPSLSKLRARPLEWADAIVNTLYSPGYADESPLNKTRYARRVEFMAKTIDQRPLDLIRAQSRLATEVDTASALARLPAEAQRRIALVAGRNDQVVPAELARMLQAALPFAERMSNAELGDSFGHLWWDFGAEMWPDTIAGFLDADASRSRL